MLWNEFSLFILDSVALECNQKVNKCRFYGEYQFNDFTLFQKCTESVNKYSKGFKFYRFNLLWIRFFGSC